MFKREDYDDLWEELKTTNSNESSNHPRPESSVMGFLRKRQQEIQAERLPVFDLFSLPSQSAPDNGKDDKNLEENFKDFAPNKANEPISKNVSYKARICSNKESRSFNPYPPCNPETNGVRLSQTSGMDQSQSGFSDGKKYPWQILKSRPEGNSEPQFRGFKTASHQLAINNQKKRHSSGSSTPSISSYGPIPKRSLGARRGIGSKFTPPVRNTENTMSYENSSRTSCDDNSLESSNKESPYAELMADERLKSIEPKMVELIMNEILDSGPSVHWDDIAGLKLAKTTIQEIVVWPLLRPDIFVGLRGPPKGILLFGPPGTGKTMIGKCIASQSQSTFFSISASSLTSKWVGEGEKMVRALFAVARCHQPAVIFMDEIDSLLTQRSESEHESSRRIKTEFLVQLDGATSENDERILVVGATNRPQELDEAARRRLVKRLYIPLPGSEARAQIVRNLLCDQKHTLDAENIDFICQSRTDGYSGADMANLCREAALGPIRNMTFADIKSISVDEVRPIAVCDFESALHCIRASVSDDDLHLYEEWNKKYGITPPAPPSGLK